ncbi:hypothetical protein SCUP234_12987 [Seiridium cupressi]
MSKGKNQQKSPSVKLAESVAFLSILDQVPEKVTRSDVPVSKYEERSRLMSFDQELAICTDLQVLVRVSDDPKYIMAVAVEEHHSPNRIHVKLAVNKSRPDDGDEPLKKGVSGLKEILDALARAANGEPEISADVVLHEITRVCRDPILRRLQSKKVEYSWNRVNRSSLVSLLGKIRGAVKSLACAETETKFNRPVDSIITRMEEIEMLDSGAEELRLLGRLIKKIARFLNRIDLDQLFDQLRKRVKGFDPGIEKAVKDRLSKLAQYHTASRRLFSHARMLELFKQFKVETVRYTPHLIPAASVRGDLGAVLDDLGVDHRVKESLMGKLEGQERRGRYSDARAHFTKIVSNTLSSGKVHAEVQLLFHYEMMQLDRSPRVIASTKSACFLCNALFRLHGKYHIPSTHGKLYPGWLLPGNGGPLVDSLTSRLNDVPSSGSSSSATIRPNRDDTKDIEHSSDSKVGHDLTTGSCSSTEVMPRRESIDSDCSLGEPGLLTQGKVYCFELDPEQVSKFVHTNLLGLFLEYPGKSPVIVETRRLPRVVAEVEWLSADDLENVINDEVHDIYGLSTETEIASGVNGQFLLRAGSEVRWLAHRPFVSLDPCFNAIFNARAAASNIFWTSISTSPSHRDPLSSARTKLKRIASHSSRSPEPKTKSIVVFSHRDIAT